MFKQEKSQFEFIALMASLMAMAALSIDALLPAMSVIGDVVGVTDVHDNQLLITMIFLGLGVGQLFFGPLSDSFGRKPMVYIGFVVFIAASFVCIFSTSLEMLVLGRIMQGVGLSAPRTISYSMIRDLYEGDHMAKIMSFVTVVFIIVPTLAPAFGKFILDYFSWQAIFYFQIVFCIIVATWFGARQKETLTESSKTPFTKMLFISGFKTVVSYKSTLVFTFISGLVMGSFMLYLSASQQIFEQQYRLIDEFPYIFAGLALAFGASTFLNGKLVMKYGMEKLIKISLVSYTLTSFAYILLFFGESNPSLTLLILFLLAQFTSLGFLFGNLKAISLQPLGRIAGIGAAITGFISTLVAVPIGTFLGTFVHQTTMPLFFGFFICGLISLFVYGYYKRSAQL
jgi:MFS transporter, DHA1 family, multidrug resistance protein